VGSDERQTYEQVVQANTVQTPVSGDVHRTSVVLARHRGHARETFFIGKPFALDQNRNFCEHSYEVKRKAAAGWIISFL
jgi:hypothetical protein